MAISNGYLTLNEYKQRANITNEDNDAPIEAAINSASRAIDAICWRRFFAASETRYYGAAESNIIDIDDLISVTTLKTDADADRVFEITWQTTDYDLLPLNAALDSKPYTQIATAPNGDYAFPVGNMKAIEIDGSFGYCATGSHPAEITEACYLAAHRAIKRHTTPLGVAGSAALGQLQIKITELKADPDFMRWIKPFIRWD